MAVHKRRNAGAGTAEKRKGQGRPIFLTIFAYVMIVVIIEVILLSLSIAMTNVSGRLNQNAKDILTMQVDNRVSYLEDLMQRAQHLNDLSEYIDGTLQQMLVDGTVTLDGLNASGTESDALLVAIAPELVRFHALQIRHRNSLWCSIRWICTTARWAAACPASTCGIWTPMPARRREQLRSVYRARQRIGGQKARHHHGQKLAAGAALSGTERQRLFQKHRFRKPMKTKHVWTMTTMAAGRPASTNWWRMTARPWPTPSR